jgi:hypothetical protein
MINDASGLRAPKKTSWGLAKLWRPLKQSALWQRRSAKRQRNRLRHKEDLLYLKKIGKDAKTIF